VTTGTSMLREVNRRRKFNPHNLDPNDPPAPVGLTDYLRMRMEMHADEDDALSSA
jgi:hypothetical protein